MSLLGALNLGQSAMAASQAGIQTTGNNIANAANADYTRQVATVASGFDQQVAPGKFVGTGVDLTGISRQVDDALDSRLRGAAGDQAAATTTAQWLDQIQSTFNALSGQDLSAQFSTFFNSWSSLANNPQDAGLRQVVLQNGQATADQFNTLRTQLTDLGQQASQQLTSTANDTDNLASQVAQLNAQIVVTEGGSGGTANDLRDQRDAALKQLSTLVGVNTVQQANGTVNVYVGSEPLVIGSQSRGVGVRQDTVNGATVTNLVFKADNGTMSATSGQLGALIAAQGQVKGAVDKVDSLAHSLIFELNKLHASGQGLNGQQSVTSSNVVTDPTVALNDPASGLKFAPSNGSFVVHVRQKDTGLETSTLVKVDLNGSPTDTSLNGLVTRLNGIDGLSAQVQGGHLVVQTNSDSTEVNFSQDTSGTLAALGVNNFFTGSDAHDIAVNQTVANDPTLLAASGDGSPGDNGTAKAIAALASTPAASLNGLSLNDAYQGIVNGIATSASAAKTDAEATTSAQQTLESQRQALSGVSLDEEAVNLIKQQQAFQGAAKYINVVNQMIQTMLTLV